MGKARGNAFYRICAIQVDQEGFSLSPFRHVLGNLERKRLRRDLVIVFRYVKDGYMEEDGGK